MLVGHNSIRPVSKILFPAFLKSFSSLYVPPKPHISTDSISPLTFERNVCNMISNAKNSTEVLLILGEHGFSMDSIALCTILNNLAKFRSEDPMVTSQIRSFSSLFAMIFRQLRHDIRDRKVPSEKMDQFVINLSWSLSIFSRIFNEASNDDCRTQLNKLYNVLCTRAIPVATRLPPKRIGQLFHNITTSRIGGRRTSKLISAAAQSFSSIVSAGKPHKMDICTSSAGLWSIGTCLLNTQNFENDNAFQISTDNEKILNTDILLPAKERKDIVDTIEQSLEQYGNLRPMITHGFSEPLMFEDLDITAISAMSSHLLRIILSELNLSLNPNNKKSKLNVRELSQALWGSAALKWFFWTGGDWSPGLKIKANIKLLERDHESSPSLTILKLRLKEIPTEEELDDVFIRLSSQISTSGDGMRCLGANDLCQILPIISHLKLKEKPGDNSDSVRHVEELVGLVWTMLNDASQRQLPRAVRHRVNKLNKKSISESHKSQTQIDNQIGLYEKMTQREVVAALMAASVALRISKQCSMSLKDQTLGALDVSIKLLSNFASNNLNMMKIDELECLLWSLRQQAYAGEMNNKLMSDIITNLKLKIKTGVLSELINGKHLHYIRVHLQSLGQGDIL